MLVQPGRFAWSRRYYTNIFGADPHIEVTLWQLDDIDQCWEPIDSHHYAVGLTGLGRLLAERKIRQYVNRYGATHNHALD